MGEVFIFSSSVLLALSTVFAHYLTKGINPLVIVLYTFSIAFILFNLIELKNKSFLLLIKANWRWVIFVNITTALDWLLIFVALKYISAALINCFVFGLAPVVTLLLTLKTYTSKRLFLKDLITCILISLLLISLSIVYYQNNSSNSSFSKMDIFLGIFLSCISGIATGATVYGCKMLHSLRFSTNLVMRSRFLIIIIMALVILTVNHVNLYLSISSITNIILLSFLFVVFPTFLLQKGIEHTLPVVTTIITSLVPVLTYLFQLLEPGFIFRWKELFIIVILSSIVILATFLKQNNG